MKPIKEFELIDHGVEHAQYFQGSGIAFTEFDLYVTGCGNSCAEALEDALDVLAQSDYEVQIIEDSEEMAAFEAHPAYHKTVAEYLEIDEDDEEFEENENNYYVSIRVK